MSAIRLIELRGDAGERGYLHGKALRDEIGIFYERWMEQARSGPNPPSEGEVIRSGMALLPAGKEYAPDLVDEIDGMAQSAGLPFEKIFVLSCYDDYSPSLDAQVQHGCTAFAATGRATPDGTTYIGQGWDCHEMYEPYLFRLIRPNGEPEALTIGHPAIIGGNGINSSRLAIVWNSLRPTDVQIGVPGNFIFRKALQQQSLAEVIGVVINARRTTGLNFIVGAPVGAIDIEATATKHAVIYSSTILHHANHYETPELKPYEDTLPNAVPDTLVRTGRMRQLLKEHFGAIDLGVCQEIMRDHGSYPGSICRHRVPGRTNSWQTQASLIYVPAEGRMLASNGRPCEAPFVEYALAPARELAAT